MLTPSYPSPETLRLHLRLPADWDGLRAEPPLLGRALDALLEAARGFPATLVPPGAQAPVTYVILTFETPGGEDVIEREFFQLCACFPELHERIRAWVRAVNPTLLPDAPGRPRELASSILAPAGACAIVPLALRDVAFVDDLVEHLRGCDLDHETFQGPLIAELARRHGLPPPMLRLVALRAVDKAGQHGFDDLRWLVERGGLKAQLATPAQQEAFAALVHETSRREKYRGLYVAQAGRHLFVDDPAALERWYAAFEARGLRLTEEDRRATPIAPIGRAHSGERAWDEVWDDAANCTELD